MRLKRFIEAINRFYTEKAPKTRMKAEDALAVARSYMEALGSRLKEPVYVSVSKEGRPKRLVWLVRDNGYSFGGNVYLRIDDETGEVLDYNVPGAIKL